MRPCVVVARDWLFVMAAGLTIFLFLWGWAVQARTRGFGRRRDMRPRLPKVPGRSDLVVVCDRTTFIIA